ncbi:MAG TPA: class I SAM-dependent methyltransferase [Amnibacterium sp.]|jgi:SAM-dependent methyltransferase|uniref:class I SAM-dependent methyltransferase n=1 Tax=Amnibacterium sp. TaxID=1872496 RepID=UPI002F942EE0
MAEHDDAASWRSDEGIAAWLSTSGDREARRVHQRRLMAELLGFADDDPFVVVDLGAGTGAAARAVLDRYPRSSAVLVDFSRQMADAGRRALEPYEGRFRYVEHDLAGGGAWPDGVPDHVDAVITSLVLHHLSGSRQQQLLAEVLGRLTPGGWFLDLDLLEAGDALVDEAWSRTADRLDPGALAERQRRHERHGSLQLTPLDRQLALLREAGFAAVDVYWKQLDTAILGGRRPAA